MRLVRGRADARWLPSRHNFAIFRLAAWLRLRRARPQSADVILFVDRHQSTTEAVVVGCWYTATAACFLMPLLAGRMPDFVAILLAPLTAVAGLQIGIVLCALVFAPLWSAVVRRSVDRTRVNSFVLMSVLALAASYYAGQPSWVRVVAWQVGAVVLLNALASVIVFSLRHPIARLEASVGGPSSAH